MTKLQRLIRRPAPERGFTLIELLVVIIILGILAAVVVFAVSGVGDKGKSSAVKIDERTLRTAEEAYCAKNGQYGSGQELVAGGFLSDSPEYHNVSAQKTGFGQCNGWTYSIIETQAASGVAAGTWAATASPPVEAGGGGTYSITRLPNGKVVALGFNGGSFVTSLWDPATGAWTTMDPQPGPIAFNARYNQELVLTQNCGQHCGKVLLRSQGSPSWHLFNSEVASPQWEPVTGETSGGSELIQTMTELRDNPATPTVECGSNCGKVLITNSVVAGGPVDLYDPNSGISGSFTPVANADPVVNSAELSALLPDGRVLLAGKYFDGTADVPIARFFNPITLAFSTAPTPSVLLREASGLTRGPSPPVLPNGDLLIGGAAKSSSRPAEARQVYSPQYGQDGSWKDVIPNCGSPVTSPRTYCQILGALPDGKVLAYLSMGPDRFASRTNPGQTYILDYPTASTWTRVPSPGGDFVSAALGDGELLDPRTGPCGAHCNKMFMVGQPFVGGAYSAAFFTP